MASQDAFRGQPNVRRAQKLIVNDQGTFMQPGSFAREGGQSLPEDAAMPSAFVYDDEPN